MEAFGSEFSSRHTGQVKKIVYQHKGSAEMVNTGGRYPPMVFFKNGMTFFCFETPGSWIENTFMFGLFMVAWGNPQVVELFVSW